MTNKQIDKIIALLKEEQNMSKEDKIINLLEEILAEVKRQPTWTYTNYPITGATVTYE